MPTGTRSRDRGPRLNSPEGPGSGDDRDALDLVIGKRLRYRTRPRPPALDPPAISDPRPDEDEVLLKYVDGVLDTRAHAEFEARLLLDPEARARVAILKSALSNSNSDSRSAAPRRPR